MSRVPTLASHNSFVRRMMDTQYNFSKYNLQSSTGQKSTTYSGLGGIDSYRLINMENEYQRTTNYITTNTITQVRLEQMSSSVDAIKTSLDEFQDALLAFSSYDLEDAYPIYYDEYVEGEVTATSETSGNLTFSAADNTITVEDEEFFQNLVDGAYFELKNTVNNDGMYKIEYVSSDGKTIKISADTPLVDETVDVSTNQDVTMHYAYTPETENSKIKSVSSDISSEITSLQEFAFNTMKSLEYYLNTKVDGSYLFGGGDTNSAPVSIPYDTLEEFQAAYDGQTVTYPSTASSHLCDIKLDSENIEMADVLSDQRIVGKLDGEGTGNITITAATNTITAEKANSFAGLEVGDTITLSGTGLNDGSYVITSNDGTNITVDLATPLADETINTNVALEGVSITSDNTAVKTIVGLQTDLGSLAFDNVANSVTAGTAGAFSNIQVGAQIEIKNSGTVNDGIYTVASNDGTTMTFVEAVTTTVTVNSALDLSNVSLGYTDPNADPEEDVRGDLFFERVPEEEPSWSDKGYITAENYDAFISTSFKGSTLTTGSITFSADTNKIVAENSGTFSTFSAGDTIVINNSDDPTNDGVYYIESVSTDGKTIKLSSSTPIAANASYTAAEDLEDITFGKTFSVGSTIDLSGITDGLDGSYTILGVELVEDQVHPDYDNMEFLSTATPDPLTTYTSDRIRFIVQINSDDSNFPLTTDPETGLALTDETGEKILPNIVSLNDDMTISSSSYYNGDDMSTSQRISESSTMTIDLNGEYAAFEKAIRALAEIAQGNLIDERDPRDETDPDNPLLYKETDTDRAYQRVSDALALLNDALEHDPASDEASGDMATITYQLTMKLATIETTIDSQETYSTYLLNEIDNIETVDPLEAVTAMQAEELALETAYSVLAAMQELTLLDYL
ncbi:MAG: hypothetical protein AB7U85_09335 [Alphaproteobacteria bacterium]